MINNPDPNTWFDLFLGDVKYPVEADYFPDGSFSFRCNLPQYNDDIDNTISLHLKTSLPQAIVALYQVVDILNRQEYYGDIILHVQTAPDQRADRVTKAGECIAAKVSSHLLYRLYLKEIHFYDLHNPKVYIRSTGAGAVLVHHINLECFKKALPEAKPTGYVVAVDKGSIDRAEKFANAFGLNVIYCDKKRVNGVVVDIEVTQIKMRFPTVIAGYNEGTSLNFEDIWVIDDLCDGGFTYQAVADLIDLKFKEAGDKHLFVTHGLFTKGKDHLYKRYATITALWDYSE